jgi:hypothetical protein
MVAKADTNLKGLCDRALLSFGFARAFRRSELFALNIATACPVRAGYLLEPSRNS